MRAIVQLKRGDRVVAVGHTFRTSPIEAAALKYQKRAVFVDPRRARDLAPVDAAPAPDGEPLETTTAPRRRYRRRDMTAESN